MCRYILSQIETSCGEYSRIHGSSNFDRHGTWPKGCVGLRGAVQSAQVRSLLVIYDAELRLRWLNRAGGSRRHSKKPDALIVDTENKQGAA